MRQRRWQDRAYLACVKWALRYLENCIAEDRRRLAERTELYKRARELLIREGSTGGTAINPSKQST